MARIFTTQNAVNCLQQCFTKFAKYAEIFRHLNKILPIVRGLWRDHNLKNGPEEKRPIGQKMSLLIVITIFTITPIITITTIMVIIGNRGVHLDV